MLNKSKSYKNFDSYGTAKKVELRAKDGNKLLNYRNVKNVNEFMQKFTLETIGEIGFGVEIGILEYRPPNIS